MNTTAWLRRGMVILLALASLFSAMRYWQSTLKEAGGGEAIAAFEKRLEPVRQVLPFERGVIGFLGEWDVPEISSEFLDQQVEYILAQYTLAPLILERGTAPEWSVAILGPAALAAWERVHPGEFGITPIGRGVYILHRQGNQ